MIRGLYTAVSGLITQEAKQQVITSNLANINTTGFKADNLAIKKFDDVLIQNYDKILGGRNVRNEIGSISLGSRIDETNTIFTQGMLQQTDNPTDFAIEGRGFFTVSRNTINGENQIYYTRDGQFHVNSQGYLVNSSGDNVLGMDQGTGIVGPIIVGNANISKDAANNIYLNGANSYRLSMVDFDDYSTLTKVGDNLFSGNDPNGNDNINVKQGFIEKSNVNIINEMINMMTVMRTFESNQKIIQAMDETLGKVVNEVGTVR
jgi:flagellar basal-body rod protein FlgF